MKRHPHRVPCSCFHRFWKEDFQFLQSCLSEKSGKDEALIRLLEDPDALLALLEHERVFQKIVEIPFPLSISPELYFFVLVRKSLKEAGISEVEVADYVAATLARHATASFGGISPQRPNLDFTYHVDFIEAMEGLGAYERFFLQVECGNQFLVLTGLFPKFLEHRCDRRGAPDLGYYESVARSAFLTAGAHPLAEEFELGILLPQLAGCLAETRHALNAMADRYLFLES
jgi:hypothetical protein